MVVSAPAAVSLTPLLEAAGSTRSSRGGRLPGVLEARYGGPLGIDLRAGRPTLIANFVSTLDGVVSYNTPVAAGGGEISGIFEPDRFVMGLLRALADAVLVGAGTVRAAPSERWIPDFIHPLSASAFAELRRELGLACQPTTIIPTTSGSLDLRHPGIGDPSVPVVIVTTTDGAGVLVRQQVPSHVDIRITPSAPSAATVLEVLADVGARVVLCEGGPHLIGQLIAASAVDEVFLTIAPQVAGRSPQTPRLSLVESVAFDIDTAPWARLVDLRIAGDHLFTRYRLLEGADQ